MFFTSTKTVSFHPKIVSILVKELAEIELKGVDWIDKDGTKQNTKVYSGTLCLDAPVKSKLLNIPGHSSKQGCPIAHCNGVFVPKGKGGAVVWLLNEGGAPRDCKDSDSVFLLVPALTDVLYKVTSLDSFHGIYIGMVKYLVNVLFFDTKIVPKMLRVDRLEIAEKVLNNVKAPWFIERGKARSLTECKNWKAHEYRNYLFYFSMPIMRSLVKHKLLRPEAADHWFNLVLGVSLLNQQKISANDLLMSSDASFSHD